MGVWFEAPGCRDWGMEFFLVDGTRKRSLMRVIYTSETAGRVEDARHAVPYSSRCGKSGLEQGLRVEETVLSFLY